jgi:hypothetical protein
MKVVYTSQAWLSIDSNIEFLYRQGLKEERVAEIIDQVFERAEFEKFSFLQGDRTINFITRKRLSEMVLGHYKNHILHRRRNRIRR